MPLRCTSSSAACEKLFQRCEENEQYGRRLCVRITWIPSQSNEFAEDVRNSVKSVIEEFGCDIPDVALEHTHRIGKYDPSGKKIQDQLLSDSLHLDIKQCSIKLEETCLKMECILI